MAEPYSHPPEDGREGVALEAHLSDVADRVVHVVPDDATTPTDESLRSVVETLAWVHDFGKATTYFQEYLLKDHDADPPMLRHHAPIGSFAAYHALDTQGFDTETCLAGFVAVAKHHGNLPNVAEYVVDRTHRRDGASRQNSVEKRQTVVLKQIKDIYDNVPDLAKKVFESATGSAEGWESFVRKYQSGSLLSEIEETVGTETAGRGVDPDTLSSSCYGLVLQCWSALVLADKTSAAGAANESETYAPRQPGFETLSEYIEDLEAGVTADTDGTKTERLNFHRSEARKDVLDNVASFAESGGGIGTLTLPTGMGKTLTGLSAAFALRDALDGDRVVYALPFTSIIDQVVDEIEEIYETDTAGRLFTAHHHLAETTIRDIDDQSADDADRNDDIAGMLGESWRAGLTVTTFVQLFESLAGPQNRQSMKLPALRDAVVVLDEPQSLPLDWWKLVPRLVDVLTEQYDATVIAMTATQPRLFEDEFELVDDPDRYFEVVRRVSYALDESTERYIESQSEPKPYAAAANELREVVESGQTTLAVCNTIDSARELTEQVGDDGFVDVGRLYDDELQNQGTVEDVDPVEIAKNVAATDDNALLHLSTRLRPADRLTLIETAKALTERGHPTLTISTQLVEAGVDISFDRVFRDLAPIDSIVQAAGRCNRSFEREQGVVTVWWLDVPDEQSKTPAEAVYNRGTTLLPTVADTLRQIRDESGSLSETDVARRGVERYFERLREDKDVGKQTYADWVDDAKAKELGTVSLIDEQLSAEIVVSRTPAERERAEAIRNAQHNFEFEELRQLLDETKPLRISVPYHSEDSETADAITDLPPLVEDEGIYELDVQQNPSHFDRTTGFVVPEASVDHQFL
ncbi:CRISPR-associated endonuclease Cas3'' [Halorhabdus sp. CBA1104]|uniref:CRISPR-associated endonuclease Cas3'' n=1 Tax=Halorhabdus sp. CBA1104 TaxID=1380432 RepID=UPI0012B29F8D|nr:CRISPR-associated endonuclease Cas3'' [Halorhabdus sp. CBA1104]QGN07717.1 CRISPR-associated endonuclease Cas3'' [Halorhabdus sp. CBA1104]